MPKSFHDELMNNSSKKEKKIVAVRMPNDLNQELTKLAKRSKKSVSQVVIEALRYALRDRSEK